MNKAELVVALEGRLGSKKAAADAIEAIVDTVTRAVARGEKVAISGFGSFEKTVRGPRVGRNPRTGTPVKIKKTSVPRFKPGTAFKDYVANPKSLPKVSAVSATTAARSAARAATAAAKASTSAARKATAKAPAKKATVAKATTTRSAAKATPARKTTAAAKRTTTPAKKATTRTAAKASPARATRSTAKAPAKAAAKRTTRTAAPATKTAAKRTTTTPHAGARHRQDHRQDRGQDPGQDRRQAHHGRPVDRQGTGSAHRQEGLRAHAPRPCPNRTRRAAP